MDRFVLAAAWSGSIHCMHCALALAVAVAVDGGIGAAFSTTPTPVADWDRGCSTFKDLWCHPRCAAFVVGHVGLNVTRSSKVTDLQDSTAGHQQEAGGAGRTRTGEKEPEQRNHLLHCHCSSVHTALSILNSAGPFSTSSHSLFSFLTLEIFHLIFHFH